eukprot:COSAG02_NODE_3481_length_6671_cov_12.360012_3_plen_72_part_00
MQVEIPTRDGPGNDGLPAVAGTDDGLALSATYLVPGAFQVVVNDVVVCLRGGGGVAMHAAKLRGAGNEAGK